MSNFDDSCSMIIMGYREMTSADAEAEGEGQPSKSHMLPGDYAQVISNMDHEGVSYAWINLFEAAARIVHAQDSQQIPTQYDYDSLASAVGELCGEFLETRDLGEDENSGFQDSDF